jgi:predicted small metal-binding protein
MGYIYECHTCGMEVTAQEEDQLIDAMIEHDRAAHNLKLAVEEAKERARQKAIFAPGAQVSLRLPENERKKS